MKKMPKLLSASIATALLAGPAMADTTITVAAFANYDQAVRMAIPLYKEVRPDVTINLVSLSLGDHHTAMTTALSTGANIPDVMAIEVGFIGRFSNAGGLEDLNKAPYNAGEYAETLSPFAVQLGQSTSGEQAGMPVDIGPGATFYRSDVLEKAGVTAEELLADWDSYIEAGKKIKAETGSYLVSSAKEVKNIAIRTGLKDGEGIYFGANNEILVESERFREAFRLAKAIRDAGLDAEVEVWSAEWNEGLRRGDITTQMMGSWLGGHLDGFVSPDTTYWRTGDLPGDTYASWGGSFLSIPKRAEHKEEAWAFIEFMTQNADIQQEALEELNIFPSMIKAQHSPFMEQPVGYLGGQQAYIQWRDAAAMIPAIKAHRHDPVAEQIIDDALESVLEQGVDIDKALANAAKQIKRRARR